MTHIFGEQMSAGGPRLYRWKALISFYKLSVVTLLLFAAVSSQFATNIWSVPVLGKEGEG